MQTVEFQIKGLSPLMMSAEQPYEDGAAPTGPAKRQATPLEQAKSHLHIVKANGRGELAVLPAINLQKSLQAAHTFMPGRKKGWKKFANGCLIIEGSEKHLMMHLPIEPQTWTVDARRTSGVRGPGPINYRPRFDVWGVKGILKFDERFISEEEARAFMDNAGQFVGVGSWRIVNGGPYGRFMVSGWKMLN